MQQQPIVQLPQEKHPVNWGVIVAVIVLVAIALIAIVGLARPDIFVPAPPATLYTNPELGIFERYRFVQPAPTAPEAVNPELAAFNRYLELHPNQQVVRENPEVRQFLQWLETR